MHLLPYVLLRLLPYAGSVVLLYVTLPSGFQTEHPGRYYALRAPASGEIHARIPCPRPRPRTIRIQRSPRHVVCDLCKCSL
jgi:hypothetical protein